MTSAGKILVLGEEQEVTELPSDLSSATAPKQAFALPTYRECVLERENNKEPPCPFYETIARIDPGGTAVGDGMTIGPEGKVYVHVSIVNKESGFQAGAVMVLSSTLQEIGWAGGGD